MSSLFLKQIVLHLHLAKSVCSSSSSSASFFPSAFASSKPLEDAYERAKNYCKSKKLPPDVDKDGVFTTNELDLREIEVYGFDYDYTLACYKKSVDYLIYNLGRKSLVQKLKYPKEVMNLDHQPDFAIRGLHYDVAKGLLMKVDSFHQIQFDSVYRGLTAVPDSEVMALYGKKNIPADYLEPRSNHNNNGSTQVMMLLADLFSVPEISLLCNIMEYFVQNNIDYHPDILFRDVKNAVQSIHPVMHQIVQNNPKEYLEEDRQLRFFFDRLIQANKKLFLVTNSPYVFVNKGMQYILGPDWRDVFDVIIVQARKPKFFTDTNRPFRLYDLETQTPVWDKIHYLERGKVYSEGTVRQLCDMTGWRGEKVLYFGDHPYSDLADASLMHGWRTGAIIKELSSEITTINQPQFKWNVNWLQILQQLIDEHQHIEDEASRQLIRRWLEERDCMRKEMKQAFNRQFGSLFRTYHNPTYFSRRLFRFADVYTSSVTNLLQYPATYTFYARRGVLPHEYRSWFV